MKETYLAGSSKEEYGESRLSNVCSALGDRCRRPGVATEDMANQLPVLKLSATSELYVILGRQDKFGLRICTVYELNYKSAVSDPVCPVKICKNECELYKI